MAEHISDLGDEFVGLGVSMLKEDSLKTLHGFLSGTKANSEDFPYSDVFIQSEIAREFGDGQTHSEWTKSLDAAMSTVAFGAVKALKTAKTQGVALTWDNVVALLNNEDSITAVPDSHKKCYETFDSSEGMNYFKFDGAPSKHKINQITSWFKTRLVDVDPKVSGDLSNFSYNHQTSSTHICFVGNSVILCKIWDNSVLVKNGVVEKLAAVAAETGAAVDNFQTFFWNREERYDKVLEVGIVRFPLKEDPYVKLYRIQLFAWFISNRILFAQNDKAGFDMEVDVMNFKANSELIDKINDEMVQNMLDKLIDPDTFNF